jgi:hypothetical protein
MVSTNIMTTKPNGQEPAKDTSAPAELRSIREIVEDLSKPIADRHLRSQLQLVRGSARVAANDCRRPWHHPGQCARDADSRTGQSPQEGIEKTFRQLRGTKTH